MSWISDRRSALAALVGVGALPWLAGSARAQAPAVAEPVPTLGPKPFIDYFRPMPAAPLSDTVWGAREVGPRDPDNGLEDPDMTRWNYWDGQILKGADGQYRMFASRWDQALGHKAWGRSLAVSAISKNLFGPYRDTGLTWPDSLGGLGHNVTALRMYDGRYAVVVSETRPGDVFVSDSLDGPWQPLGTMSFDQIQFQLVKTPGDVALRDRPDAPHAKPANFSVMLRPDGAYQVVPRSGQVLISKSGILGPYRVMGDSVYRGVAGVPQRDMRAYEDPVVWFSGGWFHIIVNHWRERRAYHLISRDGIQGWKTQGLAYEPGAPFIRYASGVTNHWDKLERPGVVIEGGHVVAVTFAVCDTAKESQTGSNGHGSKIIVVPFDGEALDRDLARL
ncbi:glycoside hydrolase family protein [Roseateles sp. DC23W]|uniref:Glycoside hydrolase family protein n=1 Tax=Pelomonas dachongensis TaxID=3299029 RepID=A0ABW7ELM9_9BURK